MSDTPHINYSRDAVLTVEEIAQALRVSVSTVERMDLPTVYIGKRCKRYVYGQVLDTLIARAA